MISVAIVGASGYTGAELLRLLAYHPQVTVKVATSRAEVGKKVVDTFGHLRGYYDDLSFSLPEIETIAQCELVFLAVPHGTAMALVPDLLARNIKIIDLSADFRIKEVATWEKWYQQAHTCPELLPKAVYGLPELYRQEIKTADFISNPGCYPTVVSLGFLPLIKENLIDTSYLIADAKSGVSGAGRKASVSLLMAEMGDSFKAYGVFSHRHQPEITQTLQTASQEKIHLNFLPHLVPMIRGMQASLYGKLKQKNIDLQKLFEDFYQDQPFVTILPTGASPETRNVKGSNYCQIAVHQQEEQVIVLSVIDNLVKGAAGQAIQNMNIRFGFAEKTGLDFMGLLP